MVRKLSSDCTLISEFASQHTNRIKDLSILKLNGVSATILATCSTDGSIHCWDLEQEERVILCKYEAKCRITCIQLTRLVEKKQLLEE